MYEVVVFVWNCMPLVCIPNYYVWYDVMISTLQKRLQYALLSLVGPSSLHIGRDKLVSEPRPTLGAPLIDRVVWPLLSLEENYFES